MRKVSQILFGDCLEEKRVVNLKLCFFFQNGTIHELTNTSVLFQNITFTCNKKKKQKTWNTWVSSNLVLSLDGMRDTSSNDAQPCPVVCNLVRTENRKHEIREWVAKNITNFVWGLINLQVTVNKALVLSPDGIGDTSSTDVQPCPAVCNLVRIVRVYKAFVSLDLIQKSKIRKFPQFFFIFL